LGGRSGDLQGEIAEFGEDFEVAFVALGLGFCGHGI
jgi:hypothetical protein